MHREESDPGRKRRASEHEETDLKGTKRATELAGVQDESRGMADAGDGMDTDRLQIQRETEQIEGTSTEGAAHATDALSATMTARLAAPTMRDASKPKVSVIIPCYNAMPWLDECFKSCYKCQLEVSMCWVHMCFTQGLGCLLSSVQVTTACSL